MNAALLPTERIERRVLLLRGEKVILDMHLAELYEVTTAALNQAVKRNPARFPSDFMFEVTDREIVQILRSQFVTSSEEKYLKSLVHSDILISQSVISKGSAPGKGGRRKVMRAFTEQGVAMLSSVLRSPRAVAVNIEIMRTFVRLRQMIAGHADLARKLSTLEKKYDAQFKAVFDAIRELMSPEPLSDPAREIGFHTTLKKTRSAKSKG
ncbi:MAG: DNA-binding protein [Opitutus sp.]|nr:DNA-binding protein [Opitutus sp.]